MRNVTSRALLAVPLILSACNGSSVENGNTVDAGSPNTSGVVHGYWPPQPLNATDVEAVPASALGGAQSLVLDAAQRTVLNNPTVLASLGDNYQAFAGSLGNPKDNIVATFLFYNYASDETITVDMLSDGGIDHLVQAAAEYQPPEHTEESARAISLAQTALNNLGFTTSELQGTALLTFPKTEDTANPTEQFHAQRLLYVTYGSGNGAIPVYSAVVNLSSGMVSDAGLVK